MNTLRACVTAAALVAGAFFPAGPTQAADLPADKIAEIVTSALQEYGVPGAAVAIATPEGRWIRAFGTADVAADRRARTEDRFAIRSITKSFVVTAVLQTIASSNGAISLDDPIGKYLRGVPNGEAITIRQLANMTSGLYNYTSDPDFAAAVGADPTRSWTTDELLAFAFGSSTHGSIMFDPGTRYQYSNTNTLLLGQLVEQLNGRPFATVLSRAIRRPVGLRSVRYLTGVALPSPSATGYQGYEDGEPDPVALNATSLGFAGAMASTVSDLAKWGAALADGDLLPPALQAQRFEARSTAEDPASPVYDRYGLGIGEVAGWWGHTGEGLGFEAAVFHQIDQHRTFAILLNASNVSDVPVTIFCRVLRTLDAAPVPGKSACSGAPERNPAHPPSLE